MIEAFFVFWYAMCGIIVGQHYNDVVHGLYKSDTTAVSKPLNAQK